jgi:hypothetical protein
VLRRERPLAPGLVARDTVVFYESVDDVLQGVLHGDAGDTIHGNDKSPAASVQRVMCTPSFAFADPAG